MTYYLPTPQEVREAYASHPEQLKARAWDESKEGAQARLAKQFDALIQTIQAEAWDEGANAAWERSTPVVNGTRYQWRTSGDPLNPHRESEATMTTTPDDEREALVNEIFRHRGMTLWDANQSDTGGLICSCSEWGSGPLLTGNRPWLKWHHHVADALIASGVLSPDPTAEEPL